MIKPVAPGTLHEYKRGRTLCHGQWYRTGFAPCELMRDMPQWSGSRGDQWEADIAAWAEVTGAIRCGDYTMTIGADGGHNDR